LLRHNHDKAELVGVGVMLREPNKRFRHTRDVAVGAHYSACQIKRAKRIRKEETSEAQSARSLIEKSCGIVSFANQSRREVSRGGIILGGHLEPALLCI